MGRWKTGLTAILVASVLFAGSLYAGNPPREAELKTLVERVDAVQKDLKTLRVAFVQTNHFKMLEKPQVLKGHLTLEKPTTALYAYTSPEPLYFLVKDGNLLVYDPGAKKVMIQDIRRHQNKIFRYLGVGQPLNELSHHFRVTWAGEEGGVVHLELIPRKRRLKRKIAVFHFWVVKKTGIPKAFEIVEPGGDWIRFDFSSWEANPVLDKDAFHVAIPKGVKVEREMLNPRETFKR